MVELTFEVKEFIEQNIDLIEQKMWDKVYDNADFTLDSENTGNLTTILLDSGLDPIFEQGLSYIPKYYLSDQKITTFEIPSNITALKEGCFSYSTIQEITIPEAVQEIDDYVFCDCASLKEVTIFSYTAFISKTAFAYCPKNMIVYCYEGSQVAYRLAELDEGFKVEYI